MADIQLTMTATDPLTSLLTRRQAGQAVTPFSSPSDQNFNVTGGSDTAQITLQPQDISNLPDTAAAIAAARNRSFVSTTRNDLPQNIDPQRAASLLAPESVYEASSQESVQDTAIVPIFVPPAGLADDPALGTYTPVTDAVNSVSRTMIGTAEYIRTQKDTEQAGKNQPSDTVEETVRNINDFMESQQRSMRFRIDNDNGDIQVQIFNSKNKKIIREIPTDEAIQFSARLREFFGMTGNMIDLVL